MALSRHRSPSPRINAKKLKTAHISSSIVDQTPYFSSGLLDEDTVKLLHSSYQESTPFKHVVVDKLFQENLLASVKDECLSQLSFTEKETDIYKVNQTGDLASLSYLSETELTRLENLRILRDALYSSVFRAFVMKVTGCGPLSGTKTDMSVNTYKKGCHLLNHDDVIGTRRVSYILYMPLPMSQAWEKCWGGALELYPIKSGPNGLNEPEPIPVKSIPPSWNQFIFFEVQPGKSFHSVEEVVVDEGKDGKQRLSISGWFHAAQEGEVGYVAEVFPPESKSSLEQLTCSSTSFTKYAEGGDKPIHNVPLSEQHTSFLSDYINPIYLQNRTITALAGCFVEESSLELHAFLCDPLAEKLEAGLRERDRNDGLGESRRGLIPPHSAGIDDIWNVKGPPHKSRYCVLSPSGDATPALSSPATSSDEIIRTLQEQLFPSPAFRAWLAHVSSLVPLRYTIEARRFRPALDYTLATSEERESRLDVVLGLTPPAILPATVKSKGKAKAGGEVEGVGWDSGEWGGWECYMAPHDGDEDPAIYRSGSFKKLKRDSDEVDSHADGSQGDENEDVAMDDSGTLLTVQPGFNRLLLVLRDEGVMHFVKYISSSAQGSRWDVYGEYEVGIVEEEEMEDE